MLVAAHLIVTYGGNTMAYLYVSKKDILSGSGALLLSVGADLTKVYCSLIIYTDMLVTVGPKGLYLLASHIGTV